MYAVDATSAVSYAEGRVGVSKKQKGVWKIIKIDNTWDYQ
jgi:hypothetical protein